MGFYGKIIGFRKNLIVFEEERNTLHFMRNKILFLLQKESYWNNITLQE